MAKIIGFMGNRVDGYQTAAGILSSKVFERACATTAEKLKLPMANLFTKRQASKFRRSEGIVFKTITKGGDNA